MLRLEELARDYASSDDAEWVRNGVNSFMEGEPLAESFGLSTAPKSRHPSKLYYMKMRNRSLCNAWKLSGEHDDLRTEVLIKQNEEFELFFWPSHKHLNEPPEQWIELRKQIFWAFYFAAKHGNPVPKSKSTIDEIVGELRVSSPVDPLKLWLKNPG